MKIYFSCRLMSGFHKIVKNKTWHADGSPAIFKLIDALDRSDHELDLEFYVPATSNLDIYNNQILEIEGLNATIRIQTIPSFRFTPKPLRFILSELNRAIHCFKRCRKSGPDLFYTDRANVLSAAAIAHFTKTAVFMRILGVPDYLEKTLNGKSLFERLVKKAFRAPFSCVLCSKDGSNGEEWMKKALRADVPRYHWINGVDPIKPVETQLSSRLNILFIGRLEIFKGILILLDCIKDIYSKTKNDFTFHIIGTGSQEAAVKEVVKEINDSNYLRFYGQKSHQDVQKFLGTGDLYLSLNEMGQLSNANLEALKAGLAIVLAETAYGNDANTETIFDRKHVIWLERQNLPKALKEMFLDIHQNPGKVNELKIASQSLAQNIPSWQERIDHEINLIEQTYEQTQTR